VLRVGLTGGIACGKSHVAARLAAGGLHVLDLDQIAREVTAPDGAAYAGVVAAFGRGILLPDGTIDRRALGARVFGDPAARERLNAVVHPKVRDEEARRSAALLARPGSVVVVEAALFVESGIHLRFDRLVVAHCEPAEQLRRLMARDGFDEAAARARIAAQMPVEEKRRFAHCVVDTSGAVEATHAATDRLAAELRALASRRPGRVDLPWQRAHACLARGPRQGPRGLHPEILLEEIAAAGGLDLERVARRLLPPPAGPWYRAAVPGEQPGPGPESLAGPLVLWALARGGPDPPFLAAAAASAARLTHAEPEARAAGCFFALVLQDAAVAGRLGPELLARSRGWAALAADWGGAPVPARLWRPLEAAVRQRGDGGELAGALAGIASGASESPLPASTAAAVAELFARPRND